MPSLPRLDWQETRRLIRQDLEIYEVWWPGARPERPEWWRILSAILGTEMFGANLFYRLQGYANARGWLLVSGWLKALSRIFYAVSIGNEVRAEGGLYIAHGHVVVDGVCVLGRRCSLGPFVTIGLGNSTRAPFDTEGPCLGEGVVVGTGAKILGSVSIGDRALIGANAVVVSDIPEGHSAAGAPAQSWPSGKRGQVPRTSVSR